MYIKFLSETRQVRDHLWTEVQIVGQHMFFECGVRTRFVGLWKVNSGGLCAYCNLYSASVNGDRVFEWLSASQK